jgi:predicted nucleic acid-binding protein
LLAILLFRASWRKDALIWSAAVENRVAIIYSEDFQDGRELEGVRFVNPFSVGASHPQ